MQADLCCRHAGRHHDPNPTVLLLLPDRTDDERIRVEPHTVLFDIERENFGHDLSNPFLARLPEPEQIEIARGAVGLAGPNGEERSTLEHEVRAVAGHRDTVEQSLVRIPSQQELEVLAALAGEPQKSCANRGADVLRTQRHTRASR